MLGAFDIQTKLNNETELMLCLRASNFIPQDFLIINKKNLIIENCVAIKNILIKSILSDSYLEQFLKYYFSISENELSDTDWTNLINVQNPLSQSFISQFDNKINFDVFFRSSKSITIDQIKKYMNPNTNQPYLFMFNKWVTPEYKKSLGYYPKRDMITNPGFMIGCDDKVGISMILYLLKYTNIDFKFIFTYCEEKGCIGVNALDKSVYDNAHFVVTLDRANSGDIIQTYADRKMISNGVSFFSIFKRISLIIIFKSIETARYQSH